MTMKVHPFAAKFPMMEGELFNQLVEDIRKDGLLHPVVRKDGVVIDGITRIRACEKAGVKVRYEEYEGSLSAMDYIWKNNFLCRDLLKDQRVMLAIEWGKALVEEAKKRMVEGGRKGKRGKKDKVRRKRRTLSEGDETDDNFIEEDEMQDTETATVAGRKTRNRSLDSRAQIAKRAGSDVTEHSVQQGLKIDKHRSGKRLTREIISGKSIKQAMKEIAPPKKKRNMPTAAWNGLELTGVILDDIRGNIKSRKPSKKQQKEFFDKELLEGLDVLEKELKLC